MRRLLIALCLLSAAACGDSPTTPTQPPPPTGPFVDLAVAVVGHLSNAPISGAPVRIEPSTGGATIDPLEQTTGATGRVAWRVLPNQRYTIRVRNNVAINAALLQGDVQWLVSLPE